MLDEYIDRKDRISKIKKVISSYISYCHKEAIITDLEFFYLASFIEAGNSDNLYFILVDSDEDKVTSSRANVVDLRPAVESLKNHVNEFNFEELEGYI